MLKCNISGEVNMLHQGLTLGMKEDREKNSAQLGKLALFTGSSQVGACMVPTLAGGYVPQAP